MCYNIHIERADENLKVKNQVLIRIEFFKAFLALQLNPQMFQTCKDREKGKKRLLLSGFIYIEDHFIVDAIFSYNFICQRSWMTFMHFFIFYKYIKL